MADSDEDSMLSLTEMFSSLMNRNNEFKSSKIEEARMRNNNISKNMAEISNSTKFVMNVKREHENAILPTIATDGSAGYDLYACEDILIKAHTRGVINTGVMMEIPFGYAGLVHDRSSYALRDGLTRGAGVIDSDYRGIIKVVMFNHSDVDKLVNIGDRCAQILIVPIVTPKLREVTEATKTDRGEGGFGSTGL